MLSYLNSEWRLDRTDSRGIFFAKIRVEIWIVCILSNCGVLIGCVSLIRWPSFTSHNHPLFPPSSSTHPSPYRRAHRRWPRPYYNSKYPRYSSPCLVYLSDTSTGLIFKTSKVLSTLIKFIFDPCPPSYSNHRLSIYIWHQCSSSTPISLPNMP
jgi:hypothetical protein